MTAVALLFAASVAAQAAQAPPEDVTPGELVPRVSGEALGGVVGGFLGLLPGAALEDPGTGVIGLLFGVPLGVSIAGWILEADGSYWWSLVGEIAGIAVLAAVIAAWDRDPGDAGWVAIPVTISLPVAGAITGFELSN